MAATADPTPAASTDTAPAPADGGAASPAGGPTERRKMPYLPALDGLRGVGIMVVLFWHAHVSWLSDGALFVLETFFVLSGFLITSLFLVERHNTGRISLKRFWHRRARRLLPAFIPLFVLVTLYSVFTASPFELDRIRGDGVTSAMYVSNWWFIFSGQSYFEGFAAPSPFRHTWSLSVEEQFYLLIAVAVFLAFRKWGPYRKGYMWIAFAGGAASAIWMAILFRFGQLTTEGYAPMGIDPESLPHWAQVFFNMVPGNDMSRLYFGTDTRLQGSLIGVATAFLVNRIDLTKVKQRTFEILAVIGIGGQIFGWLAIQGEGLTWLYTGGFFVWDLIVAAGIVAMMAPRPTRIGAGLSWKPLVWLGGLSYSIYVLHWPVYVWLDGLFSTTMSFVPLVILKLAVTFVVSYLSFRFWENPIRFKGLPTAGKKIAMTVTAVVVAIAFLASTTIGAESGEDVQVDLNLMADGRVPMMMAGDSMPQVMWQHLNGRADKDAGIALWPSTILGCGLGEGDVYLRGQATPRNDECRTWPELYQTNVNQIRPAATILLAFGWDLYDRRFEDAAGNKVDVKVGTPEWNQIYGDTVQQAIDILSSQGGKVIIVTVPCVDLDAPTPQHPTYEEVAEPHRVQAMNDLLRQKVAENPTKATLFDLNALLCPDGSTFQAFAGDTLLSTDGFHFTPEGSQIVWQSMLPTIYATLGIEAVEPSQATTTTAPA